MSDRAQHIAFCLQYERIKCIAEPGSGLDECVQDLRQIESGMANRFEHIGGGCLLLQRFTHLIEQASILDGDDGLVGKRLDQCGLLIGERSNLSPPHRDHANENTFATHRHTEQCPDAAGARSLGVCGAPGRIRLCIKDLYRPVLKSYASDDRAFSRPNTATVCPLSKPCGGVAIRSEVIHLTVRPKDEPLLGRAKLRRVLDQSFENGLQVEGRAADDLEHIDGGGLLLSRLRKLAPGQGELFGEFLDSAFRRGKIVGGRSCHDYTRFPYNVPVWLRAAPMAPADL